MSIYEKIQTEFCGVKYNGNFIYTEEMVQDLHYWLRILCTDKTGPFTEEEIKSWKETHELFCQNLKFWHFEEIKKKYNMTFIRESEPYEGVEKLDEML